MVRPLSNDIVLVGHPFAPIGMGEHVRSAWRAFASAGETLRIKDIYSQNDRTDPEFKRTFLPVMADEISPKLNIFFINGDEVPNALSHLRADEQFRSAYNIVYPAWELSSYPRSWAQNLELFDEVWAPSMFVRNAIAEAVSKPVLHMPLAVDPRLSSFMTRRQLGLPESAFIFLFLFDFSSYWQRKNPFAVLDAFDGMIARHPSAPLHLVMKLKGAPPSAEIADQLRARITALREQTQIIDLTMTENEVRNLVREADCFVSLHRSEGFGRGLAEGMALGVPVIGTGYSGNLDFMTERNSWLVAHDLIAVGADNYPFAEGQMWAEPRPASALEMMECVFFERAAARAKAAIAKRDLARSFSPRAIGLRYGERLAALGYGGVRSNQAKQL